MIGAFCIEITKEYEICSYTNLGRVPLGSCEISITIIQDLEMQFLVEI